jgi:hypothetical protein
MKRTILAVLAVMFLMSLFACKANAQTNPIADHVAPGTQPILPAVQTTPIYDDHSRFLIGMHGGGDLGNYFASLDMGIEVPFAKRFELDISDGFSPVFKVYNVVIPFESHVNLGAGSANITTVGGIIWITPGKSVGLSGSTDYSTYSTNIHKGSYYAHGGLTWRKVAWGIPTRFTFGYFRQFNNGIACGTVAACALPGANGTETDHVQGGEFGFTSRMGAVGPTVIRMTFSTNVAHLLTQGNPVCDSTFGVTGGNGPNGSCPRTGTVSGGASMGISFEFLRHKNHENEVF